MKFYKTHFFILLSYLIQNMVCKNIYSEQSLRTEKTRKSKRTTDKTLLTLIKKSTKTEESGNGSIYYLDRHDMSCDIGVLTEFTFLKEGPYKLKYDFSCVQPLKCDESCIAQLRKHDANTCKTMSTPVNDIGGDDKKSMNFLDRHHVKCPDGMLLTRAKMESKRNPNKIYYNYTCCPHKVEECKEIKTPPTPYKNFSTDVMDKCRVGDPEPLKRGIKEFKMEMDYGKSTFIYKSTTCLIIG